MTKQQFLQHYYCNVTVQNLGEVSLIMTTSVIRRSDRKVIDRIRSTIDIAETTDWLIDSNSAISVSRWDWNKFIDRTMRVHLDHFVLRAPIENYFPQNNDAHPDISDMYI